MMERRALVSVVGAVSSALAESEICSQACVPQRGCGGERAHRSRRKRGEPSVGTAYYHYLEVSVRTADRRRCNIIHTLQFTSVCSQPGPLNSHWKWRSASGSRRTRLIFAGTPVGKRGGRLVEPARSPLHSPLRSQRRDPPTLAPSDGASTSAIGACPSATPSGSSSWHASQRTRRPR